MRATVPRNLWRRLPLTLKMVSVTIAVGLAVGFGTGQYIHKTVGNLFEAHLQNLLEKQSQEDRLRFEHYMSNFRQVARLTVSQKSFHDYLAGKDWFRERVGELHFHKKVPPWFLSPSSLRALAVPRHAFLFDGEGHLREIYARSEETFLPDFLRPSSLLMEKSLGQTHIALIDGFPFMIASEEYEAPKGKATLMIVSPIDDRLLLATQGDFPERLIGLISADGRILLTSNSTDLLPPGERLEKVREDYVITGREYHDYGGAEMAIRISSFVPTGEIEAMAAIFVEKEKTERVVTTFAFISAFTLLMLWITSRIRRVTSQVEEFSSEALGGDVRPLPSGDKLEILAERFQMLKEEVVRSHREIRRESEERTARQMDLERQKRMLSLLRSVTDSVGVGVLISEGANFTPANALMAALESQFGRLSVFDAAPGVNEERLLTDLSGNERIFQISSPALIAGDRVLLVNELTGEKRAAQERERLQSELLHSRKMESVGRLAGGVAHDFNNILSAIIGYSEMILRSLPFDDPLRDKVTVVLESGERAANLTGQLLAFSRKQVFNPAVLNMNALVGGIHKMLSRIIGDHITTRFNEGKGLWNVLTDATHMEQLIVNLSVNARDAMPEGGELTIGTANVSCGESDCRENGTVPPGDYVLLTVADSGSGIAPEDVSRVFEPFFTTKEEGKGTGLGLSTVYGIVKQGGGYIFVDSRVGEGTVFRIYLPRTRDEATAPLDREELLPRGDETILLVEDQLEVRKLALLILADLGYTVIEAGDGAEALELYTKFHGRVHLLLSDMIMRKMGGQELAERIGKIDGDIRVLFMTGYAEEIVTSRHSIPGVSVLMKPLSAPRLAKAVREALDGTGGRKTVDQDARAAGGGERV